MSFETFEVFQFQDGQSRGFIELDDLEKAHYFKCAQWPEGIIKAGELESVTKGLGIDSQTTIYLQSDNELKDVKAVKATQTPYKEYIGDKYNPWMHQLSLCPHEQNLSVTILRENNKYSTFIKSDYFVIINNRPNTELREYMFYSGHWKRMSTQNNTKAP